MLQHLTKTPKLKKMAMSTDINDYQTAARELAVYPDQGTFNGLIYCALKLAGEAGEVAEKVGKVIRDDGSVLTDAHKVALTKELGDILWYVANISCELGLALSTVTEVNIQKLADRKARGVLRGSGDNR